MSESDPLSPLLSRCAPSPLSLTLHRTLSPYNRLLKVSHVNAQSLLCHIDEFRTIFETSDFDIILISESWLKPSVNDNAISIPGYFIYRNDRLNRSGGGVCAYIKKQITTSILYFSDNTLNGRPEFLFLDCILNCTHVLIAVCYKPPNVSYTHLSDFESILLDFMPRYRHVIVMGDFNCDLLGPATYAQTYLTTMLRSCNMTILPLQPTHHTATTDTLLDVIAVSDPDNVVKHGQYSTPGLSKHDLIFFVYNLIIPKSPPKFITYRNFNNIDMNSLLADAHLMPWHQILFENDVDVMVNTFSNLITALYNRHAPLVTKRVTKKPAPWINNFLRGLQKERDIAYRRAKRTKSQDDWSAYKRLRNRTQQQFRNAKVRFYYRSFSSNLSTKSLWSKIKELGIGKSNIESQISIDLDTINDFFVNIPVDLSGAIDYTNHLTFAPSNNRPRHEFSFSHVSEAEVLSAILRVSSNAVGADELPIKLIKNILPVVLPFITAIFNKSLSSCSFPSVWKLAIIRPLPKTKSPLSPSEFRPISILSALSKCLERVAHQQLSSFIERNNLLCNHQSGFRSRHSTTTALLKITDDIRFSMDKSKATILTLFDFSKAFDCVYHPLLLKKMLQLGFSYNCVEWVKSYLSDRQQCVSADGKRSNWRPVTRGVPQGSVLGPLLFSLYLNDITSVINHSHYHLYADDLQIYTHFTLDNINYTTDNINLDIQAITDWAYRHGLQLNDSKTQTMFIGSSRLTRNIDISTLPRLIINNHPLEYCSKVKNLGIILNKTLTWTEQVTEICNKVFASIHSLKRFALYLPFQIKLILVKTLVFPHFNYCDAVINDMTVELSDKLQRAQNYCIRFIFNLRRRDHVSPFFNQLSILKLHELRKYHVLMILHGILKSNTPSYLSDRFSFLSDISVRNTRHGALLLTIPIHRTLVYSKSFTISACRLWNTLPDSIKTIDNRDGFGVRVKDFLLHAS